MGEVIRLLNNFETLTCGECGVAFALTESHLRELRRSHASFYCPKGHERHFPGKSDIEKLKEQIAEKDRFLENSQKRLEWAKLDAKIAKRSAASYKGKLNHVKAHVGNGVCPCCKRTFQNLQRHMSSKHPGFKEPT